MNVSLGNVLNAVRQHTLWNEHYNNNNNKQFGKANNPIVITTWHKQ